MQLWVEIATNVTTTKYGSRDIKNRLENSIRNEPGANVTTSGYGSCDTKDKREEGLNITTPVMCEHLMSR